MQDSENLGLVYMADPMCSWCWGFSPVISQLHDKYAGRIELEIVMGGLRAGNTQPLSEAERASVLHHWEQVGAHAGAPFQTQDALPPGFVYDTEPACRAVVTARLLDGAKTLSMLKAVQAAFYNQTRDVTEATVLADIAEETGLDRDRFAATFAGQDAADATQAGFRRAREAGVNGYPALCLRRSWQTFPLFVGYQPLEDASKIVDRVLEKFG